MIATIELGGRGTYLDNDKALERIDELCDLLNESYEGIIDFSMRDNCRIDCEFKSVANAEDLLECVLDKNCCSQDAVVFMQKEGLRFEKVEFETGWEDEA